MDFCHSSARSLRGLREWCIAAAHAFGVLSAPREVRLAAAGVLKG